MGYEEFTLKSVDGYALSLHVFETAGAKAVIQCIHGMEEHQGRYVEFAGFLRDAGYTVVTADMRGHGKNAPILSHIADEAGDRLLIEDEKTILGWIQKRYPGFPVFLFGHSMGTIIARKLLQTHSGFYGKTVLSGYPNPQGAAKAGDLLCRAMIRVKGAKAHSKMIDGMVLGGFSKAVAGAETGLDWLSFSRDNVSAYAADPLCGVPFTLGSYDALFRLIMDIDRPEMYRDVQEEMPILMIAGSDDPCVGGEKGKADSLDRLTRAGFRRIRTETIPEMRHEILNEKEHGKVFQTIRAFFDE